MKSELAVRPNRQDSELAVRPNRQDSELAVRPNRQDSELAVRPNRQDSELIKRLGRSGISGDRVVARLTEEEVQKMYALFVEIRRISLDPDSWNDALFLGIYYQTQRNYDRMILHYQTVIDRWNDSEARILLADYYMFTLKDAKVALSWYQQALELPEAQYQIGYYYHRTDRNFKRALAHYELAAEGNHSSAHSKLGDYYKGKKNYPRMKFHYERAIQLGDKLAINSLRTYYLHTLHPDVYQFALKYLPRDKHLIQELYSSTLNLEECKHWLMFVEPTLLPEKIQRFQSMLLWKFFSRLSLEPTYYRAYLVRDVQVLIQGYFLTLQLIPTCTNRNWQKFYRKFPSLEGFSYVNPREGSESRTGFSYVNPRESQTGFSYVSASSSSEEMDQKLLNCLCSRLQMNDELRHHLISFPSLALPLSIRQERADYLGRLFSFLATEHTYYRYYLVRDIQRMLLLYFPA